MWSITVSNNEMPIGSLDVNVGASLDRLQIKADNIIGALMKIDGRKKYGKLFVFWFFCFGLPFLFADFVFSFLSEQQKINLRSKTNLSQKLYIVDQTGADASSIVSIESVAVKFGDSVVESSFVANNNNNDDDGDDEINDETIRRLQSFGELTVSVKKEIYQKKFVFVFCLIVEFNRVLVCW